MSIYYIPVHIVDANNLYTGSRTEINLWTAFLSECMARNRYTYYASTAKKAGYEQMAEILLSTAENEKEHAKIWLKELNQLDCHRENLFQAAEAEHYEHSVMYPKMAEDALADGYPELSQLFLKMADIENNHENRFRVLLKSIDKDEVFARSRIVFWECRNCGHLEVSLNAPELCPVCNHSQSFFQVKSDLA